MVVAAVIIGATVVLLYGPITSSALTGDSYQWIQHAHHAAHRPALLMADLDTFYRPSTTWTLVADRVIWGGFDARGYRITSLILHGLTALLLVLAGRRLGLGWIAALACGMVWATSPFADESAFVVAYRFQPLLLSSWLFLIAVWPRRRETWTGARVAGAVMAVVAAAAAKETWVVTPILVAALEFERAGSLRRVVATVAAAGVAVAAYLAVYIAAFPSSKTYFDLGQHVFARIPAQLATFLFLERPTTDEISMTWMGLLAVVLLASVAGCCMVWRVPGSMVAGGLFLVPILPTLFVPFLPQRYLAIPYAGFLLLIALWVGGLMGRFPSWRSSIRVVAVATTLLIIAVGATIVRGDLQDHQTIAEAHQVLLDEATEVAAILAPDAPLLVVRDEVTTPLVDAARSPAGFPKLVFVRNEDPYGLIDTAALFEWVRADESTFVRYVDDWVVSLDGKRGVVLAHHNGGFIDLGSVQNVAGEASRWVVEGRNVRIIRIVSVN